jgi:hypothetical protein
MRDTREARYFFKHWDFESKSGKEAGHDHNENVPHPIGIHDPRILFLLTRDANSLGLISESLFLRYRARANDYVTYLTFPEFRKCGT